MVSEDHVHPLLDYMILAHGGVVSAFDLANLEVGSQGKKGLDYQSSAILMPIIASSQHAESMPSHNGTAQDRPQNHLVPASGDHKRVFTLFPYFPPELHFYVWEQTCPPPRLVSLGLSTARYQKGSRASNGDDKTWVVRVKYSADSPLHGAKVLSESCIETRNAFARKYQRLEVFPPVSGFTTESWIGLADWLPVLPVTVSCTSYIEPYIDFENDTLHLDFDQYISLLAHGCSIDMSRVTRLAFDAKTTSNPHDDFFEVFLRHISALPALKHFSFILNDLGGAHPIDKEREKMEKVLVDMDWTFLDSESWGFTVSQNFPGYVLYFNIRLEILTTIVHCRMVWSGEKQRGEDKPKQ